jgi:hypothetical protein
MMEKTEHELLVEMLLDAGYNSGWTLNGLELQQWEHEADPPAPLTRPA